MPVPKLILLDLNMPGKDGLQVLKELKKTERLSLIPVIIYSTSSDKDIITKCYEPGANCFITKPSDYQEIVALTKTIIQFWPGFARLPHFAGSQAR